MALPSRGTLGQVVTYNGYSYKWTGTSWLNIGVASTTTGQTSVTNTGVAVGQTSITNTGVAVGQTSITNTGVSVGQTSITNTGVSVGQTSITNTGVSVGQTSITNTGVSVGQTSITNTGVSVGQTSITNTGLSVGQTSITNTGLSVGQTSITNTGLSVGQTSITNTGLSVSQTNITNTGVSVGQTNITNTGVAVGQTSITNTAVTVGQTSITNTAVTIGQTSITNTSITIGAGTINALSYTGTANNALHLGGIAAANYVTRNDTQVIGGNYTFTNVLNANVANFAGDVVISNNLTITGSLTFTGTSSVIATQDVSVSNSVISLHSPAELAPLGANDGRLIGLAIHYYDTSDKQALLAVNQSNAFLTYYRTSTDIINGDPAGNALGTIQAAVFHAGNSIVYSTVNATNYSGTANNALYLGGVAAQYYANLTQLDNVLSQIDNALSQAYDYTDIVVSQISGNGGSGNASQAYTNAILYVYEQGFTNQAYLNARGYVNSSQLSANLANYTDVNFVLQSSAYAADVAYNNTVNYINSQPLVYFSDLVNYASALSVVANAAAAYTNAITFVTNQNFVNTSFLEIQNYVTNLELEANLASVPNSVFVLESASVAANLAYSNAIAYINSESGLATGEAITANAATTYANAIQYVSSQGYIGFNDLALILNNYANITLAVSYASNAYSNAIQYVTNQNFVNTSFLEIQNYVTNLELEANLASVPNTTFVLESASVAADLAYSNAIAYIDSESGLATGENILANAATTYANAIQYVSSQGYIGFNDLASILNNYANIDFATSRAQNAYSNALIFVTNQNFVNTSYLQLQNYVTNLELEANLASVPNTTFVLASASVAADLAYSNVITYINSESGLATGEAIVANAATTYANAIQYVSSQGYIGFNDLASILNGYSNNQSTISNAAAAYTNAINYVTNQNFVNTSFLEIQNYVTNLELEANLANIPNTEYVITAATYAADVGYANAVQYVLSQTGGATSEAIIANATAAYTNALAYVNEQGYVSTAQFFTQLVNYSTTTQTINYIANQGFTNTSQVISIVETNAVNTQQVSAIVDSLGYVNEVELDTILINYPDANYVLQISGGLASNAYTNSVAYVDGKSYVNSAQLSANLQNFATLTNAATAYTNAVAYVDGKSFVNSAQLAANLDNYASLSILPLITANAATAYTNAVAYVNSRSFVNTSQLSANLAGLINTSSNYTFTGIHTYNANLVINRSVIINGDSGIPGQVLTSNGSSNVYWSTPSSSGGGAGGIFDGGTPFSTFTDSPILDAGGVL